MPSTGEDPEGEAGFPVKRKKQDHPTAYAGSNAEFCERHLISALSEIYKANMRARYGIFPELLPGTLQMLILRVLQGGPLHGCGIARRIEESSKESLAVEWGSLYPALYKMQRKGWLQAQWGLSEHNRKARFYRLTAEGRQQLEYDMKAFQKLVRGIRSVMRLA